MFSLSGAKQPAEDNKVSHLDYRGVHPQRLYVEGEPTATARSIASSIADIDHALTRLDDGVYGLCEVCDEAIPEARLNARPATARCVSCAS